MVHILKFREFLFSNSNFETEFIFQIQFFISEGSGIESEGILSVFIYYFIIFFINKKTPVLYCTTPENEKFESNFDICARQYVIFVYIC